MQYLAIITMEYPNGPGQCVATLASLLDLTGQLNRLDLYNIMREEVVKNYGEQFAHANVVYFSAEPNALDV
jgi:hypothetical protein